MTEKQRRIHALIQAIIENLETCRRESPGVELVLNKIAEIAIGEDRVVDIPPRGTRHDAILERAISGISGSGLTGIATCLSACKNDLVWCEDDGQFYGAGADLGDGYQKCNLHSVLIGPDGCGYRHPDFLMGVFMLGPRTLYRDHHHAAPELYLNLSERSGWRFSPGDWTDYPAGSIVWNLPGAPHATRVYAEPFISVFVWLDNIDARCHVMQADDWEAIERGLMATRNEA